MFRRFAALIVPAVVSGLAMAGFAMMSLGSAQVSAPHVSFVVATGSAGGTYFPIGQAIAEIISHPPGVARCDGLGVCGPPGLVASARSSLGSVANVRDVNAGRADSGLAQSDIIADAWAGRNDFRRDGPQTHIRVIADLFPEEVHLVAARSAHITNVPDLRGKRVALGAVGSGTERTARAILAAYRIADYRMKVSNDPPDIAAQKLERGDIDAFFFVGGAPVALIQNVIASGKAVLLPIDGPGRNRLVAAHSGVSAQTIPAGDYSPGAGAIETVGVKAVWVVSDSEPPSLVYSLVSALFNPANRTLLDSSHPSARWIRGDAAMDVLPAPLHPGAARYFRETGTAALPRHGT